MFALSNAAQSKNSKIKRKKTFDLNVISIILARTDTAKLTRGKGFVLN